MAVCYVVATVSNSFLVLLLSVASFSILASGSGPRLPPSDDCPVVLSPQPPLRTTRVIGGDAADKGLASSLVFLLRSDNRGGTGILVAPDVVAFFAGASVDLDTLVYIGLQSRPTDGRPYSISSVHIHPLYDSSSFEYDFAYAILTTPVSGSQTPVKVNINSTFPQEGSFVRNVGYGQTIRDQRGTETLYQVDVPVLDADSCFLQSEEEATLFAERKLFCSGYGDRKCSKCDGDGPVIQYDDAGNPVLVGLWATGYCGEENKPDIDINVAHLADILPDSVERTSNVVQVGPSESGQPAPETQVPSSEPGDTPLDPQTVSPSPSHALLSSVSVTSTPSPLSSPPPEAFELSVSVWVILAGIVGGAVAVIVIIAVVVLAVRRN